MRRTTEIPITSLPGKTERESADWRKKIKKAWLNDKYLYFMMLPILIYFILFKYIPMIGTIIAFKDFSLMDGIIGSAWVGLKHFTRLFSSRDFYVIIKNTLLLNFYNIIFYFPTPIILSLLLNEIQSTPFKKTVQSVLYVPYFISWVVLGGIIISLLSPSTGVVNQILKALHVEPIYFMRSSFWWPVVFVGSSIWHSAGWGTIVYMAAIAGIDQEQYEAALIDGASRLQKIWYITLPGIRNTIAIMLILRMGQMLDVGFEQIYMLQNDAVIGISEVISTYEYRIGLEGAQYSYATAIGLFKGFVGFILIVLTNKSVQAMGEEGLW